MFGRKRPRDPSSVFTCVQSSLVPTPLPPPRKTIKTSSGARNTLPDELDNFLENDRIENFYFLCNNFANRYLEVQNMVCYKVGNEDHNGEIFVVQSAEFVEKSAISLFLLKIYSDFTFEGFSRGIKQTVESLAKNRIKVINRYSILDEVIRFLKNVQENEKTRSLMQHVSAMGPKVVGDKLYSPEMIIRAFEYFAISRSLYERLRTDYQLPSIRLLTNITSKFKSNLDDDKFIKSVFESIPDDKKKHVVILFDEVYVQPALLFHGGSIFGRAVNSPENLATTVLTFMIAPLLGGPTYI